MAVVTVWSEELPLAPHGDWTVDDLVRLPDDGRQYELFDGVLFKRALYADSGVEHFWIFDPREPSLTTYTLNGGEYVKAHAVRGDETADIAVPFPVSVCPGTLTRPGAGGS